MSFPGGIRTMVTLGLISIVFSGPAFSAGRPKGWPEVSGTLVHDTVRIGEPVIVHLTCRFEEPQVSPANPNVILSTQSFQSCVEVKKDDKRIAYLPLLPSVLYRTDTEGLEYSRDAILFFNHDEKRLIFDTPGRYTVTFDKYASPIEVTVNLDEGTASESILQLLHPHDFLLLEFGTSENKVTRAEGVSRLIQISDKSPKTQVGMWAGARLGLEFFEALAQKQTGVEANDLAEPFRLTREQLLAKAETYLTRGYTLNDKFPLREEVLYSLSSVESLTGHPEKAAALAQELATKYPFGRYRGMAASIISRSPQGDAGQSRVARYLAVVVALLVLSVIAVVVTAKIRANRSMRERQ